MRTIFVRMLFIPVADRNAPSSPYPSITVPFGKFTFSRARSFSNARAPIFKPFPLTTTSERFGAFANELIRSSRSSAFSRVSFLIAEEKKASTPISRTLLGIDISACACDSRNAPSLIVVTEGGRYSLVHWLFSAGINGWITPSLIPPPIPATLMPAMDDGTARIPLCASMAVPDTSSSVYKKLMAPCLLQR